MLVGSYLNENSIYPVSNPHHKNQECWWTSSFSVCPQSCFNICQYELQSLEWPPGWSSLLSRLGLLRGCTNDKWIGQNWFLQSRNFYNCFGVSVRSQQIYLSNIYSHSHGNIRVCEFMKSLTFYFKVKIISNKWYSRL